MELNGKTEKRLLGKCCLIPFIGVALIYFLKALLKITGKHEEDKEIKDALNRVLDFNLDISLTLGIILLLFLQFVFSIF